MKTVLFVAKTLLFVLVLLFDLLLVTVAGTFLHHHQPPLNNHNPHAWPSRKSRRGDTCYSWTDAAVILGAALGTLVEEEELASPPDPESNPNDDGFRSLRRRVPKRVQYFIRDSGALRSLTDGSVLLLAREICKTYPSALSDFWHLSSLPMMIHHGVLRPNSSSSSSSSSSGTITTEKREQVQFKRFSYGEHARQIVDLILQPSREQHKKENRKKLVLFVHGGFWGSGFPSMYRLVAKPFVENGYHAAVLGYRTFPDTNVDGQIKDIAEAIAFLRRTIVSSQEDYEDVILIGHSSGAHIGMLGILRGELNDVDRFVGLAGVYDIPEHYSFERGRGIERLSPLAPVCGGSLAAWKAQSPARLAAASSNKLDETLLPPMLILHGEKDTTVPYTSSIKIARCLNDRPVGDNRVIVDVLPGVEHAEILLQLMFGGRTQEKILAWLTDEENSQNLSVL